MVRCHGWSDCNVWAVALEKTVTEGGISFLNEGLNGTLPSKDWNYCHMKL